MVDKFLTMTEKTTRKMAWTKVSYFLPHVDMALISSFLNAAIWPVDVVYDRNLDDAVSNYIKDDVCNCCIVMGTWKRTDSRPRI